MGRSTAAPHLGKMPTLKSILYLVTSLLRLRFFPTSLHSTKPNNAPAPPLTYPTCAPSTPASFAQFHDQDVPAQRKLPASSSCDSSSNIPPKATGWRSSYP